MADRLRAGVVWANTFNKFDPTSPLRRLQGVGLRPRGRPARPRRLREGGRRCDPSPAGSTSARPTSSTSAAPSRAASRGRTTWCAAAEGASSRTRRSPRARTPGTPSSRRARPSAGWAGATAYNRGQVLYRVAEMLEGRRDQFVAEVAAAEGVDAARRAALVDAAIDRWVWYAGWSDKIAQVAGAANPVAGPYFNLSLPEPTGVVAVARAAGARRCSGWSSRGGTGDRRRERRGGAGVAGPPAAGRDARARCWRRPTCPAASSTCLRASTAEVAPWLASHEAVGRSTSPAPRP